MDFIPLAEGVEIKVGDTILVKNFYDGIILGNVVEHTRDNDIIYSRKRNQYFNLGLYLSGNSSHKEVYIIK